MDLVVVGGYIRLVYALRELTGPARMGLACVAMGIHFVFAPPNSDECAGWSNFQAKPCKAVQKRMVYRARPCKGWVFRDMPKGWEHTLARERHTPLPRRCTAAPHKRMLPAGFGTDRGGKYMLTGGWDMLSDQLHPSTQLRLMPAGHRCTPTWRKDMPAGRLYLLSPAGGIPLDRKYQDVAQRGMLAVHRGVPMAGKDMPLSHRGMARAICHKPPVHRGTTVGRCGMPLGIRCVLLPCRRTLFGGFPLRSVLC